MWVLRDEPEEVVAFPLVELAGGSLSMSAIGEVKQVADGLVRYLPRPGRSLRQSPTVDL